MPVQILTCVFKLRPPTGRKRALLLYALTEYTQAVQVLLDWVEKHLGEIEERGQVCRRDEAAGVSIPTGRYTKDSVAKVLPPSGQWSFGLSSPVKEGAIEDACRMVAGYLMARNRGEQVVSFPRAALAVEDLRERALIKLRDLGLTEEGLDEATWLAEEARLGADLERKPRAPLRSLLLVRGRDVPLLMDEEQQSLFVALSLLPARNERNQPLRFDGKLIDIATGKPVRARQVARTVVLCPLEMGQRQGKFHWQFETFLRPVMEGRATIKGAKLALHADGDFMLKVAFAMSCPEAYPPAAYLGVAQGVLRNLTYALIDGAGAVLRVERQETGLEAVQVAAARRVRERQQKARRVTVRDYRGKQQMNLLYNVANYLLERARAARAAIVVEAMNPRAPAKDKRLAAPWRKLVRILEYQCALAGIPFVGEVFGTNAHRLCPGCGEMMTLSKATGAHCPACNRPYDPTETQSINIARRALYHKATWATQGGYRAFHTSFTGAAGSG